MMSTAARTAGVATTTDAAAAAPAVADAPAVAAAPAAGGGPMDLSARLEEWRRLLLDTSKRSRLVNSKFGRGGVLAIEHPEFGPLWELLAVREQKAEFPWPSRWVEDDAAGHADDATREAVAEAADDLTPMPPEPAAPAPAASTRGTKGTLSPEQLHRIRESAQLASNGLLTDLTDRPLDARLKRLSMAASTSLSEQGVNSLFMVFGFLRWFESADSDEPICSPLVLLPVSLRKPSADSCWELAAIDDELVSNHSLGELLRSQFRLDLPTFDEDALGDSGEALLAYLAQVERAVASHPRWQVQTTAGLGTFAFQKISMWQDLRKNEAQITAHPLCRGIAGDASKLPVADTTDILQSDLDEAVPPETSCIVRDCDGSQLAAMEVVRRGHSLILDGPPGTGKSQTITNLIARCLAENKTVLFVSEKAAALEVVKRRLDEARLGDFCLECHSHKANKRAVVEELGRCLNREADVYPSQDHKLAELRRTRQRLNDYVRALHAKRSALGISAYGIHGRLSKIRTTSATLVPIPDVHQIDRNRLQAMEEAVGRLASCGAIIAAHGVHPWRGARTERYSLTLIDDIRFHFARAAAGLQKRLDAAHPLERLGFLSPSAACDDIGLAVQAATTVLTYPKVPSSWVEAGLAQTAGRYIALHELSENFRILWSSVPAYQGDAHLRADAAVAAAAAAGGAKLKTQLTSLPASVRQQIEYLISLDGPLQQLMDATDKLDAAGKRLTELLGLPDTSLPRSADDLETLAASAASVGQLGQARTQWFDATERKRLRQVATSAKEIALMALATRAPLEPKFQPAAFRPIASEPVEEVLKHGSWFRRLGGSWRRAKQSFCPLYRDRTPAKSREILDDAFQLRRFHRYAAQLESAASGERESLGWDGTPEFDWDALTARLDTLDRLPADLQASEPLRASATASQSEGRTALLAGAQAVRDARAAFSAALARVLEIAGNPAALGGGDVPHAPLAALKAAAGELRALARGQVVRCEQARTLLNDRDDAAVEGLAHDFSVLAELRGMATRAGEIAGLLGEALPDAGSRSLGDWQAPARLAEWVVGFLKEHGGSPPAHVVRAISDESVRAELKATIDAVNATDTPPLREGLGLVESLFPKTEPVSTGLVLGRAPVAEVIEWLALRARDAERMNEWVAYTSACADLRRAGLAPLLAEVLEGRVRPEESVDAFRQRFYRLWLDEAYRGEPVLGEFDPGQHDQAASRFRDVDRFCVNNGFAQVRPRVLANTRRAGGGAADEDAPDHSELGILLREVHKRRRHLPLRRLFAAIPTLLPKLKPCLMMSPLAVSTYFDASEVRFDVVIFDEASQVRPHDAICAIYRGAQLVVAGDQKQLPPTDFFERLGSDDAADDGEDDAADEAAGSSNDYESILDLCATLGLPRQRLKWHYRSKRESLIAFSNRHFYGGELVTFPSVRDVDGSSGVEFCFVENGRWAGGSAGGVNAIEAERIADRVIRHASERPGQSLGVITMNQAQQMHVIELIEHRRRASLHLEAFFAHDRPDPFFVKNLENVQGDERDVIFLGVGYAKNDAGTLSHNFGPLNRHGGERRLNVAVTRAREALTLFASIRANDVDLSRTQSRGAKLLRAYLDFAERGTPALAAAETEDGERDYDSDFEAEVARTLADQGLNVHRQVGCSGYRIDLALMHPSRPGQYVLGVECDGATYHSSSTARDRDRLRQDVLESLGWKLCRIWSTDWVRDPKRQVQKVLRAYEAALAAGDAPPAPPPRAPEETVRPTPAKAVKPPRAKPGAQPPAPHYDAIDDVPADVLARVLAECVESFGAMPLDDLTLAAARRLGFARTGARIRERIARAVRSLQQRGELIAGEDGRLRPQPGKSHA